MGSSHSQICLPHKIELGRNDNLETFFQDKRFIPTAFFREAILYYLLEKKILPYVIQKKRDTRRKIRVWSVGCSSGQEVYSLAIIILEALKKVDEDIPSWYLRVHGTDLNESSLEMAKAGEYRLSQEERKKMKPFLNYFEYSSKNQIRMRDDLKRIAQFHCQDVFNPPLIGNFDIILCFHLLMYYQNNAKMQIVSTLKEVLNEDGYLFLDSITTKEMESLGFTEFEERGIYQKQGKEDKEC